MKLEFGRLVKIKEWIDKNDPGAMVILLSCAVELKLLDLADEEEQKKYLEENKTTRYILQLTAKN